MKKNYALGIDLQTLLLNDKYPQMGKEYWGILRAKLPSEGNIFGDQFIFTETAVRSATTRRNIRTFEGQHITCTKNLNGDPRLNFKNLDLDAGFNVEAFALEVANEVKEALKGFVEE